MNATQHSACLKAMVEAAWAHNASLAPGHSAFVLLEDSTDTALGDIVTLAKADKRWHPLPDPYFAQEPEAAPVLIAWPTEAAAAQQMLRDVLDLALKQVPMRTGQQRLGALLWSQQPVEAVLDHLMVLAALRSPEGESVLYRFQDPRVLQWLWPSLSDQQKLQWLGPLQHWWAVEQPFGPWVHEGDWRGQWWQMTSQPQGPQAPEPTPHTLLNAKQWQTAHTAAAANRVWGTLHTMSFEAELQPDAATLKRWLSEAVELGLDLSRATGYALARAYVAARGQAATWDQPQNQAWVQAALQRCAQHPEALFDSVYMSLRKRAGHVLF